MNIFSTAADSVVEVLVSPYKREKGSVLESLTHTRVQTTRPWHEDQSNSELGKTCQTLLKPPSNYYKGLHLLGLLHFIHSLSLIRLVHVLIPSVN